MTSKNKSENPNFDEIRLDPISHIHRENNPQFIASIARGLEILRCFSSTNQLLGNQEIAQLTNLPKPTVARITSTLVSLGYLKQLPSTTKYLLDIGVLALGYAALANISARTQAQPFMEEMSRYAQAPVAMATRDRLTMMYLNVVHTDSTLTMRRPVGSTLPIHSSAMGRACLAAMETKEREYLIEAIRKRNLDNWPAIKRNLERSLRDYHDYGYCLSIGDWAKDVNSVAVPLIHSKHGILVFNCGAPSYLLDQDKLENKIGPRLIHMVNNISASLNNM
ncbi:IclR family transcriptional regulator [Acinetobacter johnsonii]|jgi:DNA-binding IclR family transcriptional regulator|uniref:IclR family transcriptional regulator n=1 Tax=Acinetobacter TaxID=469 RepID=UPI0008B1D30C|nr:IclR family transcriptional regulator [Acinetobacter johnsonii]OFW70935.1 MAG: IclR family transcriptional regulator [Acinetobacter sp. RIFCSPHIGHO2_12_41_5]OHC24694.1 MAG: IclR family transcriptional regulator [Pseudomonadales bacterium RIFCSPHIGHO2_12_FULL_40_16]MCV2453027.1 IclR family transcriptional regulator [Acinetobacter johnsonii]QBK69183.1 IclR family transcriptional regulator [Acinetobacter johnsonii]SNU16005.1 Pca regulon regulatory protein [Acinetobacter johnsonii]